MNKSEVDALQVYLNDTGCVVVYIIDDENYEVNAVDYKWTRLHNWEPDKLTEELADILDDIKELIDQNIKRITKKELLGILEKTKKSSEKEQPNNVVSEKEVEKRRKEREEKQAIRNAEREIDDIEEATG